LNPALPGPDVKQLLIKTNTLPLLQTAIIGIVLNQNLTLVQICYTLFEYVTGSVFADSHCICIYNC